MLRSDLGADCRGGGCRWGEQGLELMAVLYLLYSIVTNQIVSDALHIAATPVSEPGADRQEPRCLEV